MSTFSNGKILPLGTWKNTIRVDLWYDFVMVNRVQVAKTWCKIFENVKVKIVIATTAEISAGAIEEQLP